MPDISMCKGGNCVKREECYRYTAVPNDHYQSYFGVIPYDQETGECEYFWDNAEYKGRTYTPDYWVCVRIESDQRLIYKIFGSWNSGSWRLNSGIVRVSASEDQKELYFHGYSSSKYIVRNNIDFYRLTGYTQEVLQNTIVNARDRNISVEILPFQDFTRIDLKNVEYSSTEE